MPKKLNLIGQRFGRLTVVSEAEKRGKHRYWDCVCTCGNKTTVETYNLISGRSKSCGCFLNDKSTKHGDHKTRLFKIWTGMRQRCNNPHNTAWKNYGGRGIKVCDEWNEYATFREWAKSHGYSDDLTLDRIDPNGDYTPSNCRWASRLEQAYNRRNTRFFNGKTLSEWSLTAGIPIKILKNRVYVHKWPIEKAISQPIKS